MPNSGGRPAWQPTSRPDDVAERMRLHRAKWEARWRTYDAAAPAWRLETVATPVRDAVDDGWFASGMTVLDIGCGSGEQAAWLAGRAFDVVGVDVSRQAIERAQHAYAGVPRLTFRAVDVCRPGALRARFDALVDRGCLHTIERSLWPLYARNAARWAENDARFLLLMRWRPEKGPLRKRAELVRSYFGADFDLVDYRPTNMGGPTAPEPIPGAAFRLVRQSRPLSTAPRR